MQAPPGFELRAVSIGPGDERGYDEAEWRDAVVFMWQGQVELEGLAGASCTVERGDVLWLVGLPLRALCNRGCEPALLIAVSRQRVA